ncbi:MAG: VOC family protein [Winogradskyella sp.]
MQQRLTIITLGVKDLKKSTDFYETKFGWHKTEASNANISFFKLNGILLSLYNEDELAKDAMLDTGGYGFKKFTMAYNVTSKKEVDATIEALRVKGVTIIKEPQEVFWGGYSAYVSDLDDNLWEIAYIPFLDLDEYGNALN